MEHVYTSTASSVLEAERDYIRSNTTTPNESNEPQQPLYGLALSGGGIRSASFSLGILQALASNGKLKKIDYLSTASGGGYIGSSLTWFLNQGLPDGSAAGTDVKNFPFGRARKGSRHSKDTASAVLNYLRQHGCYLTPGNGLDFISFVAFSVRTILVSVLVYFLIMTIVLTGLKIGDFLLEPPFPRHEGLLTLLPNYYALAALLAVGFFVGISILYSLSTKIPLGSTQWRYRMRVYNQLTLGALVKWAGIFLVLASLPLVYQWLDTVRLHVGSASLSTATGAVLGWLQYRREQKKPEKGLPIGSAAIAVIAAVLIIYGLLMGAYVLSEYIDAYEDFRHGRLTYYWIWAVMLTATAALGLCVNINYSGLHRMYRDRLMEAFLPDAESVITNQWNFSEAADNALMEDMCQTPNRRPYHLINANVVLVDSETAKYRERGGDNFIFSPLYCGSDATGWRRSSLYMKKATRGITLASAMAISGAAINPNTGTSGRGLSRNRWVSLVHSLLNLRLGYWAINPKYDVYNGFTPNFIVPGLTQSIITRALKEDKYVLELTDGGHFENLAIYELVRRKLKVIIACDGGADGNFNFDTLGNAIEKVRVDFGTKITFDNPALDLPQLFPGSSDNHATAKKYQTAKRGFAVATIDYADGTHGTLIYIKATMVENLPTDVYSYKSACPDFPHQSTLDQFFDEVQMEAYRELGYYLGWQMLEANAGVSSGQKTDPTKTGRWI